MDLKLVIRSNSHVSSFKISCLRFIAFSPYFELRRIVARMRVSSSDSLKSTLRADWVDSFSEVSPSRRSQSLDSLAFFCDADPKKEVWFGNRVVGLDIVSGD